MSSYLLDPFVREDPRAENESFQFCVFLCSVYCISSRSTQKEHVNVHTGIVCHAWHSPLFSSTPDALYMEVQPASWGMIGTTDQGLEAAKQVLMATRDILTSSRLRGKPTVVLMLTVSHSPPSGFSSAEKLSLFASFAEDFVPFQSPDKNHESQLDTVFAILKEV